MLTIFQSKEQILSALKRFCTTSKYWNVFAKDPEQAVVILATPSFAKWFEDDSFIARFLEKITRILPNDKQARKTAKPQIENKTFKPFELDVLCACVDGLSPDIDWMPYTVDRRAKEGFSILQGRTLKILPNLWDVEDSASTSSPTITASLTFAKATTSQNESQVVLPLANTLFLNGRHSTLLVSKWRVEKDSFVKVRSLEKRNQTITVFDGRRPGPPSIRVPAIPLTPARRIVSGLGNIVKQVDFGEGPGPASRELEANIDEYLFRTGREKAAIAVWALIVPKALIPDVKLPPPYSLLYDMDRVRVQWRAVVPSPDFVGNWLNRGAKFCRVLSGGGGWGVKQGLLSLDPQSSFNEISEARFDFSTGSLEDQQTSALGKIAEPDAYIQFFIADNTTPAVPPYAHPGPAGGDIWQLTTVIGTVPSTVDDQRSGQSSSGARNDIICQTGHFGAVSESGMFLSASSTNEQRVRKAGDRIIKEPAIHTKIDLPYSYIYRDMRREAKPSKSSAQSNQEEQQPTFSNKKTLRQ